MGGRFRVPGDGVAAPGIKPVTAGAIAAFFVYAAWLLGGWPHGEARAAINDVWFVVLPLVAAVAAGLAARRARGRQRAAWAVLAAGLIGQAVGNALWAYYELVLDRDPFPSAADVGYLSFPLAIIAALLLFPAGRSHSRGRAFFDALIVSGSVFFISWVTILDRVFRSTGENRLAMIVSLAYPVLDVAILALAAILLAREHVRQRRAMVLLSVGVACVALADSAFSYLTAKDAYASGNPIDLGWVAGFLVITVAAAVAVDTPDQPAPSTGAPAWTSVLLPYAPLLLAVVVASSQPGTVLKSGTVPVIGVALASAVIGRQAVAAIERRRLLASLERARRDPLTGLANRTTLHERLQGALQPRNRGPVGVVTLDLNDFTLVNDSLGAEASDRLLISVARKLRAAVGADDTVARLTGDHYAVLVLGEIDRLHAVADRVLAVFEDPFSVGGVELLIFPNVGLAIAPAADPDVSGEDLLRRADVAMQAAKRSRIGGVQTFTPLMIKAAARWDPFASPDHNGPAQLALLGELRQAIKQAELRLLYQPQVDLGTSQIVSVEALVRWRHPERGLLGPDQFLPLVRRHGLMAAVNDFVLNQALDDALEWRAASFDLSVAVNFFAPTMTNPALPGAIGKALADRGLDPSTLTIEITEQLPLDDMERARGVIDELRSDGIRVALDDFGSGYSTLSQLRDLSIDEVKLDRGFISPIASDESAAAVVRAVMAFIHALNLRAVAEGVENAETEERLRDYGCDLAQGYLYSQPLTSQELLDLLRNHGIGQAH